MKRNGLPDPDLSDHVHETADACDRLGPVDAHSVDAGETQSPHANAVAQRDLFALAMTIVSRALPPSVYHVDVPDQGLW